MPVVSIRISKPQVHERLKASAAHRDVAISTLAERLIDEGLRMDAHRLVVFRDGPAGRRPALVGGPEIVDVVGAVVGSDVPVSERRARAAELLGVTTAMVDAAIAYYADYTDEVDAELAARATAAQEAQAAWRRQRALLER